MAQYAIGDVQGCYDELQRLLAKIDFDESRDVLWFTGDLVNRGPQSLAVLRFVHQLAGHAITVLGNHDLHLLAVAIGATRQGWRDTFDDVLAAADRDELIAWLRTRPLLHWDRALRVAIIHAGLVPQWDLATAECLAREAEQTIRTDDRFFAQMYGDEPERWHDKLRPPERTRFIVNALTRLRFCDAEGRVALAHKGPPGSQPAPFQPWYTVWGNHDDDRILFGHWSLLGAQHLGRFTALDSGCLWGRRLTAVRLDVAAPEFIDVPCRAKRSPHKAD